MVLEMNRGNSENDIFLYERPEYRKSFYYLLLSFLGLLVMQGCIVYPTVEHDLLAGRGEITEEQMSRLDTNNTTREEVLLRFGEPAYSTNSDKIFMYFWQTIIGGGVSIFGPPPPGAGHISKYYVFLLEFSDSGLLVRHELISASWLDSLSLQEKVNDWTYPHQITVKYFQYIYGGHYSLIKNYSIFGQPVTIHPVVDLNANPFSQLDNIIPQVEVTQISDESEYGADKFLGGYSERLLFMSEYPDDLIENILKEIFAKEDKPEESYPKANLSGVIKEFKIERGGILLSRNISTILELYIDVTVENRPNQSFKRLYTSRQTSESLPLSFNKENFEKVINASLIDLMNQIVTDPELIQFLNSR